MSTTCRRLLSLAACSHRCPAVCHTGGPLFRAVNTIADNIKDEFPNIAVDTLAYQWSRPAPKITKPRPNVIIRLCSIECNFAAPLVCPPSSPPCKSIR